MTYISRKNNSAREFLGLWEDILGLHATFSVNGAMTPSSPNAQNMFLWGAFRDVHSYEKLNNVDFSVALDHPEESSCWIFDDCVGTPETMLLVIDTWDNIRVYDAGPQGANYSVDLTVEVEERVHCQIGP